MINEKQEDGAIEYSMDAIAPEEEEEFDVEKKGCKEENNEMINNRVDPNAPWLERYIEVIKTFWPLGFVAFGGPQAHIAILRDHLVIQRGWMDEEQFTELFAIGQGLPGPTSTQLVISTALSRAGPIGGLTAFFLWNIPGLVVLTTCGTLLTAYLDPNNPPFWLVGLPPAAVSLVFKAFYDFVKKLDTLGMCLALCSTLIAICLNSDTRIPPTSSQYVFPITLLLGGIITYLDSKRSNPFSNYKSTPSAGWKIESDALMRRIGIPIWVGGLLFVAWLAFLLLPILLVNVGKIENKYLQIFELMYRIGSIIFGGGQVVLPLLEDEVVPAWMNKDQFLQGLGLAQSMPGPLFNFASFLGAVYANIPGALVAFCGIFGPGVVLIFAMVPFWARLRHVAWFKAALQGVNATAIGLIGAACVILWESAVRDAADAMVFCLAAFIAVVFNVMAPLVVLSGGILGAILHEDALNLGQLGYCE